MYKHNTVNFKGIDYPLFQVEGNAAQFAIPYAKHFCKGKGYDIGCSKIEWSFPGSIPIDLSFNDEYHASNLPPEKVDYIFSSHCLEHVNNWVKTLDYWIKHLTEGGTLFLYLPDYSQEYWRPWNNQKHINILTPEFVSDYLKTKGFTNIFLGEKDLNNSFMIVGAGKIKNMSP